MIMRRTLLSPAGKRIAALGGLLLTLWFTGCGGSSKSSTGPVATIAIAPLTASVPVNRTQAFTARAQDSNGNTVSNVTFSWSSSATAVASIDSSGLALGHSAGTTQIAASVSNVTSPAATLTVTQPIASVSISPVTATVAVGGTQQFTATAVDANGNTISGVVFAWACINAGVATINGNGLATGVAPGTVTIAASASGVTSPLATLTVTP